MDEKALKKIIKQLVRESLTEIFAEMKLENIVESVISRKISTQSVPVQKKVSSKFSVREAMENAIPASSPKSQSQPDPAARKRIIMEKLGVGDDMWKDIYADTASSNNPILENKADESPDAEGVPVSVLESMGLVKDYSKHIGVSKTTVEDDTEWQQRRADRAKIMENIKRM